MRQTQQLLALQVLGVSKTRLLLWLLPMVLILVSSVALVSEVVSPVMALWAKQMRSERASAGQISQNAASIWVRTKDGFLRALSGDDTWHLRSVYHFVLDKRGLNLWSYTPSMRYQSAGVWVADELICWNMCFCKQRTFVDKKSH